MRKHLLLLLMGSSLITANAFASGGERPTPTPTTPSASASPSTAPNGVALTPRQQAEQWYADAYDDVAKGKQELADGKAKNAEKRFRRALERAMRATQYDTTYHEAWNLAGFSARRLGDYPKSLAAYRTSIRLKGDYAPAREYYGHALLESGDLQGAEEQLTWLQKHGASELAASLEAALKPKRPAPAEGHSHH